MNKRQVWRYKCDFCKKANCSSFHIAKHEKGCTNNPNRECGMCAFMEQYHLTNGHKAMPLADAISKLLPPLDFNTWDEPDKANVFLERLRKALNNCPACTLAALRQAPADTVAGAINFDYKAAAKAFWDEYNDNQVE